MQKNTLAEAASTLDLKVNEKQGNAINSMHIIGLMIIARIIGKRPRTGIEIRDRLANRYIQQ